MILILEISEESIKHALDVVEWHTDEMYGSLPLPASKEWVEFQRALKDAYEMREGG